MTPLPPYSYEGKHLLTTLYGLRRMTEQALIYIDWHKANDPVLDGPWATGDSTVRQMLEQELNRQLEFYRSTVSMIETLHAEN